MLSVFMNGVGVYGPGLPDWNSGREVLASRADYRPTPVDRPPAAVLSATERRRSSPTVLLAVQIAAEAMRAAALPADRTAMVFASSGGDLEIAHDICVALAQDPPLVSPTRFHNSVHNAAAGYWSIATGSRTSATSLSCFDASFTAGLLEAAAQAATRTGPTLLVAYDWPPPPPLHAKRPLSAPFGVALALDATRSAHTQAMLEISLEPSDAPESAATDALEPLRRTNPAARSLSLLVAVACGPKTSQVVLPYLDDVRCFVRVTLL